MILIQGCMFSILEIYILNLFYPINVGEGAGPPSCAGVVNLAASWAYFSGRDFFSWEISSISIEQRKSGKHFSKLGSSPLDQKDVKTRGFPMGGYLKEDVI